MFRCVSTWSIFCLAGCLGFLFFWGDDEMLIFRAASPTVCGSPGVVTKVRGLIFRVYLGGCML